MFGNNVNESHSREINRQLEVPLRGKTQSFPAEILIDFIIF